MKPPNVTPRQAQILDLVSQGFTCEEAAKALYLSPWTVKTHLHHLYIRLDVKTAAQAVRRGFELGVLAGNVSGVQAENTALKAELANVYKALAVANSQLTAKPTRMVRNHAFGAYLLDSGQAA